MGAAGDAATGGGAVCCACPTPKMNKPAAIAPKKKVILKNFFTIGIYLLR